MEIQLQELIDKIKKDGIETASEEAAKIKREAEEEAARIVAAAEKEASNKIDQIKADTERLEKSGKAALEQASRNLLLAFKGEVQSLLDKIVVQGVSSAYDENTLKQILPELFKSWAAKGAASGSASFDLLLSEADMAKLKSWAQGALAEELKKGVELKSDRKLGSGFRIANKDGSAYYDFSAESVAEFLSNYLNPNLVEILSGSAKGI